ncbi:unnamed protein product, partial [Iphiclides podalirius]
MGVTGLWRLIEPAGKPVPIETLENKVLAVDISIWLHQMVKGYQDAKGAPIPNAHLIGLFQRLCKLLYFRIKPVFVFDGGFPELKKETIAKRQDNKSKYNSESERLKREIALLLGKKTAISSLLGKKISPKKSGINEENDDDIFKLPALSQRDEETESDSEDEQNSSASTVDLHTVDVESDSFKNLPAKEKYDLLVELKETRKMNSWGKLHTLPKKSDNFSDFQMQRLLKRRKIQECLEETEKEIGDGSMSINELESLLNEEGIDTKIESLPTRRIAANNTTRFLLINNVKEAIAEAKKNQELLQKKDELEQENNLEQKVDKNSTTEEDELQMAIKMSLECVDEANISAATKTDESWTSFLSDSEYSNSCSEDDESYDHPDMSSAKAYIMQYSDFTNRAIDNIVNSKKSDNKSKIKGPKIDKIIEDLKAEKSVIVDKVNLSSDEEEVFAGSSIAPELNKKNYVLSNNQVMDTSQASIICLQSLSENVIELETSTEEEPIEKQESNICSNISEDKVKNQTEVDSTDSEFEEVPEKDCKAQQPVVELTLNMGEAPDDDIFADVFEDKGASISTGQRKENDFKNSITTDFVIKADPLIEVMPNENSNKDKFDVVIDEQPQVTNKDKIVMGSIVPSRPENFDEFKQQYLEVTDKNNISKENDVRDTGIIRDNTEKLENDGSLEANQVSKKQLSSDDLNSMMTEMQNNENDLLQEKGRMDRIGRNISEQMTKEAQELLQIFGIPYIVAPTEAEAQCAFLESIHLTDGTITDDSDIWLFGGRTVYKNFFNQKKHVLQFLSERIEKAFNLTREQLILLALLVGSDYTTGVPGVGPVTALEILASFPFNRRQLLNETSKQAQYLQIIAGLQEFKKWVRAGKRTDNTSLKKKLRNVQLTEDFPSIRVVQAYLEPKIEKSEEKFTWGHIDITILRDYAKQKFGWSQNKLDEIIKPVLGRLTERKTQKSLQEYFKKKIEFQSLEEQMSKRVKAAVQKMGPENTTEIREVQDTKPKLKSKRKANKVKELEEFSDSQSIAQPSTSKKRKDINSQLVTKTVKVCDGGGKEFEIIIPKTDRYQEVIPQREKDKQDILQKKMKAIEIFRKSKIDKKTKRTKRSVKVPKENADLSESSDEN